MVRLGLKGQSEYQAVALAVSQMDSAQGKGEYLNFFFMSKFLLVELDDCNGMTMIHFMVAVHGLEASLKSVSSLGLVARSRRSVPGSFFVNHAVETLMKPLVKLH